MKAAIIIPARYASERLQKKLLLRRTGKPLIQYAYEQAKLARNASAVIVATDDQRIFDVVNGFGGEAVMTDETHESGTSRAAEAAAGLDADIIVNLQGDEPEINPSHIDRLIDIASRKLCFAATLACPFGEDAVSGPGSPEDPAAVKAILGSQLEPEIYRARYFTRSICPYPRDAEWRISEPGKYLLHVGVYAFLKANLMRFAAAPAGALEITQRLEQLRMFEMGEDIAIGVIDSAPAGIDTPEDYQAFVRRLASSAN